MKVMTIGLEPIHLEGHRQHIINTIKEHRNNLCVFGVSLWENIDPASYWHHVREIANIAEEHGVTFAVILNSSTSRYPQIDYHIPVLLIDFFLLRTVYYLSQESTQPVTGGKISFLPGKVDKPHRGPLLKKFEEDNLLHYIKWSLHTKKPEYQHLVRHLDEVRTKGTHFNAFPLNLSTVNDTCCSLVSETNFITDDPPWITEKTWKPVYLNHPFVIAASPGTLSVISEMGFDTYTDLLPYPDYDLNLDNNKRLDEVYQNILALRECASSNEMTARTEYNRSLLVEIYKRNIQKLEQFALSIGIHTNAFDIVPMYDQITESKNYRQFSNPKSF